MKIKRLYATFVAAAVAVSAFGCGSTAASEAAPEAGTEAPAKTQAPEETKEEPAQEAALGSTQETASANPAMKYVGAYKMEGEGEFYLLIEVSDDVDGVLLTAAQTDPKKPYMQWAMSGQIDDTLKISYTDGIKSEVVFNQEKQTLEESVIYSDGTGAVQIADDGSVTWQDDKEDIAGGKKFVYDEELSKEVKARMEEQQSSQNPVMNWAGRYFDKENISRTMQINPSGDVKNGCTVIIDEEGEEGAVTRMTMTGIYDEKEKKIVCSDGSLVRGKMDEAGNFAEEETVYTDGTGTITFDDSAEKITAVWHDDKAGDAEDVVFEFNYNYSDGSSDGSTSVTEDDHSNPEDEYVEEELTVDEGLDEVTYEGEDD